MCRPSSCRYSSSKDNMQEKAGSWSKCWRATCAVSQVPSRAGTRPCAGVPQAVLPAQATLLIFSCMQLTCLQEVGELAVAVGHVGGTRCQRCKYVPQRAQGLVDGAGLLLALALGLAATQPFAAGREGVLLGQVEPL